MHGDAAGWPVGDALNHCGGAEVGDCDGPQGAALHRGFPFVDYVNRGEGEVSFTRLLVCLRDASSPAGIPGLCWRDAGGTSHANAMSAAPLPASALVTPDYTDCFEQHAASRTGSMAEPHLLVESSRGCWWGQKHHCTFCELNGSFMELRSKSPDRFVDELLVMTERYRVLNVAVADDILDMAYLRSAVPRLAEAERDLRSSYEIKSNMRREQLAFLVATGIHYVQPGIESLSGRVLKLMDKGVTGCQHHLAPPDGVTRIAIERFSPYFNRPELAFGDLRPAAHYAVIYDLPETELRCWRERDEEACEWDGVYMGEGPSEDIAVRTVSALVARGAQHVALREAVALGHGDRGSGRRAPTATPSSINGAPRST